MPSKDMTKNFASMREKILSQDGKQYWRGIDEMAETPEFAEFVKREYPLHSEDWNNSFNRRSFVKLMGGTLALAGLSGCVIQPPEKIVPRVRDQEDLLPGKPLFFATAMTLGGVATGLLAESYEGRPIKLEGSPEHPGSLGATDVLAQASLMDMYDPDRSQQITFRGSQRTWQNFMTALRSAIEENRVDGGAGIRFLSETVTSPTLQAQMKKIATELPNSRWYQYEPVNSDNAMAGARLAFGQAVNTVYKYDLADRILTLDKDIFSDFNVRYIKDFAKRKNFNEQNKHINRLYAVETTMTLTGAKADHRLAVKPSQVAEVAKAIAAAVGVGGATSGYTENSQWIAALAKDLQANRGKSIVVAGNHQPPVVHALGHAINGALGNVGQTVLYTDPLAPFTEKTQVEQLRELIGDIDAGRVKMLVFLGGNPAYNTPADLKLSKERLEGKVPLRIHLGSHVDETGELCHWHIPQKHYLESWGDARAYDGTITIIQPLIEKLYDSRSVYELAQLFFREDFDKNDLDIVKGYWQTQTITPAAAPASTPQPAASPAAAAPAAPVNPTTHAGGGPIQPQTERSRDTITIAERPAASPTPASPQRTAPAPAAPRTFEDNWRKAVHDGFVPNTALPTRSMSANAAFLSQPAARPSAQGSLEIAILPDPTVYDGRFANNGWLQELPKPLNKVTWENVALVSPATARKLGVNRANDADEISGAERPASFINSKGTNVFADLARLKFNGGEIAKPVPVWITPGQPDDVVTLFMGGGRTRAGRIGTGVGYSAFDVTRSDAMSIGTGELTATGEKVTIASTQIHFNMEGRDILRVFDLDDFEATPDKWHQEDFYEKSMYYEASREYQKQYDQHNKWGMSIDLNSCIGCNACVIACQAENNIPVVGKEQVERSREMHWLRVDAYYHGDDVNNASGPHFQPVLCMQCEQAPCEVVCPVTATVHNAEGLNDMVYNRCVGTRYCSNNCPYKVRRFNFLLYQDWDTPQYKLMRNPEVSIRSRGVMEKCTYCTQRISAARIEAQKDGRPIADGEVMTACQAICPTDAIIFGDLNDPHSRVSIAKKDHRNYNLLNELNTQPRTTYLAALKNRNKEMPDLKPLPEPPSHGPAKEEGVAKPTEGAH